MSRRIRAYICSCRNGVLGRKVVRSKSLAEGERTIMSKIYLLIEGVRQGPFTEELTRESLADGSIPPDLLAWREGEANWIPVSELLGRCLPPIPPLTGPPLPSNDLAPVAADTSAFPWYRSTVFVGLLVGIPWLCGHFLELLLKPFMLAGLFVMASGPLFYRRRNEVKTAPKYLRWVGVAALCIFIPYYFIVALGAVVPDSDSGPAIKSVLQQDHQLIQDYRQATENMTLGSDEDLDHAASLTRKLADGVKAIPTDQCPSDFRAAYLERVNGWSGMADILEEHPHIPEGEEALVSGFVHGLAGDPTGGTVQLAGQIDALTGRINAQHTKLHDSWGDVQAVAQKYGVSPSDYGD